MPTDRIEKQITINAPVSRVWSALTDYQQFGEWFRVRLEGPFVPGEEARGPITWPGYEHILWRAVIQEIDPEQYFAFTWHPYAVDPAVDYSEETPTLVEFRLAPTAEGGTLLTLTESGFSDLPDHRRDEAFLKNDGGWTQQIANIEQYVTQKP